MYIATLTLTRVFICDPANPSLQVICGSSGSLGGLGARTHQHTVAGDFRHYAGNRTRLVTKNQTAVTIPITLRAMTPQQFRQMARWRGTLLLFRDTYGTRIFGGFLDYQELNIPRTSRGNLKDMAIQFQNVSYSDRV